MTKGKDFVILSEAKNLYVFMIKDPSLTLRMTEEVAFGMAGEQTLGTAE